MSSALLIPEDAPEDDPEVARSLSVVARSLAFAFFGGRTRASRLSDAWLVLGCTGYMQLGYLQAAHGPQSATEFLLDCRQRVLDAAGRQRRVERQRVGVGVGRTLGEPQEGLAKLAVWAARCVRVGPGGAKAHPVPVVGGSTGTARLRARACWSCAPSKACAGRRPCWAR